MLIQNQFKKIPIKKDLLIENSKYYSYGIGNLLKLSKLNIRGNKTLGCH